MAREVKSCMNRSNRLRNRFDVWSKSNIIIFETASMYLVYELFAIVGFYDSLETIAKSCNSSNITKIDANKKCISKLDDS